MPKSETAKVLPPLEFIDKMHDWMCDAGCGPEGHEWIACKAWEYFMESQYYAKN